MSWSIEELQHGTCNILDEQGLYVAEQRLGCQGTAEWRERKRALLRLAVAAPDLLDALKGMLEDADPWRVDKAREAVAKAKGCPVSALPEDGFPRAKG